MATTNEPLTKTWSLAASIAADPVLLSLDSAAVVEIATTAADETAPTVSGHTITGGMAITRDILGAGAIWARVAPRSNVATASLVVS